MRSVSDTARMLIESAAFTRQWVFDLMYDGQRRLENVPIASDGFEPDWAGGQFVTGSASARIVWADHSARSIIPRQIGDWFSPFGAELQVDCVIRAGQFAERIPIGRYVVEAVPDAVESNLLFQGRLIHPGESFTVTMKDPLMRVQRDEFPYPTAPVSTSAWDEIQRITGLPVIRNVTDAAVPLSMAYTDGRDEVLSKLFDLMGAWPHMDSSGALTARPKAWPAPVDEIRGVVSAPISLASDKTYNRVVVEGKDPEGDPIYAVREVSDGFLRVRNLDGSVSPFGGATYRYSSDFLTTQAQCDEYARDLLPRVSRVRGVTRDVTEPFNPLREVGDVLTFRDGLVRVRDIAHRGAQTHLVVEVPDQ